MHKLRFSTTYKINGLTFESYVVARSRREALRLIKKRKLKEKLDTSEPCEVFKVVKLSDMLKARNYVAAAHTCCFMLSILGNKKIIAQSVTDGGLLHDIIHLAQFAASMTDEHITSIINRAELFEKLIPGWM